jgi:hypothetical protein
VVGHCSRRGCSSYHRPTQCLDDAPGHDVLGATARDVELLVVLIVVGLRVRVAIDDLDHPFGILELHLLLLITLVGNKLLAFPLKGRCAIMIRLLLLLLTELLRELLNVPVLLGVVAPGVVHRAPWTALIMAEGLPRPLVTTWAMAPTSRYSSSSNGCSGQAEELRDVLHIMRG